MRLSRNDYLAIVKNQLSRDNRDYLAIEETLLLPPKRKSHMVFQLAYLHLTFANSKGHDQGHAHFDCEYLTIGIR